MINNTVLKNSDNYIPDAFIASNVAVVIVSELAIVSETSVIKNIPQ